MSDVLLPWQGIPAHQEHCFPKLTGQPCFTATPSTAGSGNVFKTAAEPAKRKKKVSPDLQQNAGV